MSLSEEAEDSGVVYRAADDYAEDAEEVLWLLYLSSLIFGCLSWTFSLQYYIVVNIESKYPVTRYGRTQQTCGGYSRRKSISGL